MKKIIKFEEDGELDVLVDCDGTTACSFLVPWKWLGDSPAHDDGGDDDDDGVANKVRYNMIGDCYGRVTGTLLNGKIDGTVLLWHYCFNHGICHHRMTMDGMLAWGGGDKTKQKMACQNNWVCTMEFKQGKMIGKPKIHPVVMKRYRCRSIWRVFFSSLPMGRNSLKSCAQWWGGEGYVPVIIEWS